MVECKHAESVQAPNTSPIDRVKSENLLFKKRMNSI
jgi:hypothetical protein